MITTTSLLLLMLAFLCVITKESAQAAAPISKPEKCGNITIWYPFGIGSECAGNETFVLTCNTSLTVNQTRPFIRSLNLEVLHISVSDRTVQVNNLLDESIPNRLLPVSGTYTQFKSVLDWTLGKCLWYNDTSGLYETLCSTQAYCYNQTCYCKSGYGGNPYLTNGCLDKDECSKHYGSPGICVNMPRSYSCDCPSSYEGRYDCYKVKNTKARMAIIGTTTSFGAISLLIGTCWLWKLIKRRRKAKLKRKIFGLLLQQQLSSGEEGNVEKTKLFSSKELEKATDHYNENRILGQGGQGTVYKGMLTDGRIVAVKMSKIEDGDKIEEFINEVVILSKINHRNVVKLHGCCLENEVPLLVYEFIPNGTLFQYIHCSNEELPLSWDTRLRIATEVAGALTYLHSAASVPIYHRDIKSTNILLDDKYRAKVADFGTSRSISIEQTHVTTRVLGTFGYLDPEYFQSGQFTDKSDVYSFGVVLVELLTGQKPILSSSYQDRRSLATLFILKMKENRLFDILDAQVVKQDGAKEEIMAVAALAKRCLNFNGRKRPAMKEVIIELVGIRKSNGAPTSEQPHEEESEYTEVELTGLWDRSASTSVQFYSSDSISTC